MWQAQRKERFIKEISEGGRPLGRIRYIWKDIIKINIYGGILLKSISNKYYGWM